MNNNESTHHYAVQANLQARRSQIAAILSYNARPLSDRLLSQASDACAAGQHNLSVILSQTACEVFTESTIAKLLELSGAAPVAETILQQLGNPASLAKQGILEIYKKLTHDEPQNADWWESWKSCRKLRHGVVHKGEDRTADEAQRSVAVANKYIGHITAVMQQLTVNAPSSTTGNG